jgi:two-component system, OmpR family, phosphate regulon response regulator PhoB
MRILLVDDDAGLRALLPTTFEAVDVELEEADDAPAAAEAVRRHRPDVVVLDVHMPGGSGLDLCRDLKADPATDGISVVLLTGSNGGIAESAGAAGANAFLRKPFSPLELLSIVERLAGGLHPVPARTFLGLGRGRDPARRPVRPRGRVRPVAPRADLRGMRRLLALALVVSAAGLVTGCSGVDVEKAQGILDQSTTAMADVKSVSFAMRMWTSGGPVGTDFTLLMHGGGYQKGKRAGESYATLNSSDAPGLGAMTIVIRHDVLYVKAGGSWSRVPAPANQAAADPLAGFDITRYVTDVRVEEGVIVGGEPMDRIAGVIDTSAALSGILGTLGGTGASGLANAFDVLGDIRAVLYVSQTTHLPMRTLIDMPMKIAGQTIVMHVDLVITGVNRPVAIPSVG